MFATTWVTKSVHFSWNFWRYQTLWFERNWDVSVQKFNFRCHSGSFLPLPHHYGRKSIRQQNVQSTLLKLTFNLKTSWAVSQTQTSQQDYIPNCPNMVNPTPTLPPQKNIFTNIYSRQLRRFVFVPVESDRNFSQVSHHVSSDICSLCVDATA